MLAKYAYEAIETELRSDPELKSYLEIGSFDGEGIAKLCKLFPDRKFYSIDPFIEDGHTTNITSLPRGEKLSDIETQFIKNTKGLKNLTHYKMTTERFIDVYQDKLPIIDILLIDGDHTFYGCTVDLLLASSLSQNKELLVYMDDINKDTVNRAFKFFANLNDIMAYHTNSLDLIKFRVI